MVLFDEIEKANPEVLNILLQILEDGKLTNSNGAVANFQETVVVLTSNLCADIINKKEKIGFNNYYSDIKEEVISEAGKVLKPELINRLDEIIVFNHLKENDIYVILNKEIRELRKKMNNKGIDFEVSPEFKKHIIGDSNYFKYGARVIKREVQSKIEDIIVDRAINGQIINRR